MRGKLTGFPRTDTPEDPSLGDAFVSQLPQRLNDVDMENLEFIQGYSQYLISDSLDRGEDDITILDVFETPDVDFFRRNPDCPLRFFGEIDLLSNENAHYVERFAMVCEQAFQYLQGQQVTGMFINTVMNMLDMHATIHKERPGIAQWSNYRKDYIRLVAPACFNIFPVFVTARDFLKTTTIDYLLAMSSDDGIIVDETNITVLPRAMRNNIRAYLRTVPGIIEDPDTGLFTQTESSEEFHNLILSGIRNISAARLI